MKTKDNDCGTDIFLPVNLKKRTCVACRHFDPKNVLCSGYVNERRVATTSTT